jgi:hypothetical protein
MAPASTGRRAVAAKVKVTGGNRAAKILKAIGSKLSKRHVRVGFLETATYPAARTRGSGKNRKTVQVPIIPVAQVAFWQNFGTKNTPARPFFNDMINKHSGDWGDATAQILKGADYDEDVTLQRMGELLKGQLRQQIIDTNTPPNAPYTIEMKNGATKVLVDSGVMLGSVDAETKDGPTD